MKATERLIYQNSNGEKIEISWFSSYTPLKFTEELTNELTTTKNNYQNGYNYVSDSLESREITIDGFYQLQKNNLLERNLKRVFNPTLSGKLIFDDGTEEKYINVKLESLPSIDNDKGIGKFSINFVAHDPFWRVQEKTEYIALLQPMLSFPLAISKTSGMLFGIKKSILETEIENVGDVESGFRVRFIAKGEVVNPAIINSYTGEKIKINITMKKGDIIEVINEPTRKLVYFNGAKRFNILDRLNTNFFTLDVGKNLIGYQADVNVVNLDVVLYYSPLYM